MGKYALVIKGRINAVVKDKDGRVVKRHRQAMHSFTNNFSNIIASLLSQPTPATAPTSGGTRYTANVPFKYSVVDTSNTAQTIKLVWPSIAGNATSYLGIMGLSAGTGDSSFGIVVGYGTTPVSPSDYKLEYQYPHGQNVGQLYHHAVSVGDPYIVGSTFQIEAWRTFVNYASQSQTVSESGLIAKHNWDNGLSSWTYYYLIARDVWSTPVSIPAYGSLILKYTLIIST